MYLDDFGGVVRNRKPTYTSMMKYWRNVLFEYSMKLFTWKGLPESIPQREIESRLYMYGKCGINYVPESGTEEGILTGGGLYACDVSLFGVTNYYDEYNEYTWNTPLNSGTCRIDVDGVLLENNSLRDGIFHKINYYANILSHTCLSYISGCVNGRANTVVETIGASGAQTAQTLLNDLYEGKVAKVVNRGFSELRFTDINRDSVRGNFIPLYSTIGYILADFLTEIGIKKANEKKERMLVDEVKSNNNLLLLNMKDLYEMRKEGAKKLNKVFGLNVSVECNVDIDGDGESEVAVNEAERVSEEA